MIQLQKINNITFPAVACALVLDFALVQGRGSCWAPLGSLRPSHHLEPEEEVLEMDHPPYVLPLPLPLQVATKG